MTIEDGLDVREFLEEGVWIKVPDGTRINVFLTRVEAFSENMATQDDFHPLRVIGNLKFADLDHPERTQFAFDPPLQMKVRFSGPDAMRAMRRGRPLALAFWQGDHWVRFPEGFDRFRPDESEWIGHMYYEVREIGDPAICWGT